MEFKLNAPYQATGDQPEAIRQLVEGIENGYNDQVLLGATGTGKSLGSAELVYIVEKHRSEFKPRLTAIGKLIDDLMAEYPDQLHLEGDSQVLDLRALPLEYFTQSFEPHSNQVGLCPVQSVTRHAAPAEMFRVQTACGRNALMTGDHNLWVLRAGRLQLIRTSEARQGDYLPVPESLLAQPDSRLVSLPQPDCLPDGLSLSLELLRLFGYFIAGAQVDRETIHFAAAGAASYSELAALLDHFGIPGQRITDTKIEISSPQWVQLLSQLCGETAIERHLPDFWPQLPDAALGQLLGAYYDGSGHLAPNRAVVVHTSSPRLAQELGYALLRFGIWARLTSRQKSISGSGYYSISITGPDEIRRFQRNIGFKVTNKQRTPDEYSQPALSAVATGKDIVPFQGQQLHQLRAGLSLDARALSQACGLSVSALYRYENNRSPIARVILVKLLSYLHTQASQMQGLPVEWWQSWENLKSLCRLRWSPVKSVEPVEYRSPFVYDLCIPGSETFLAGAGGFFVHNTFTIASVIQKIQKPALVMAHNKTLAAQLYAEFKEFFPENAVEYFVSYYDYYQPEAYVPRHDLYIEKDADINEEIERLRLAATTALMSRKDVIIVASVSCIYGLGSPEAYGRVVINLESGNLYRRNALLRQLVESHYERNDLELRPGVFRVRGDSLDVIPAYQDKFGYRITFFGDEIERIVEFDTTTGELRNELKTVAIYPAKHFITDEEKLKKAIADIEAELAERLAFLRANDKLLEAQRLEQRTLYDLEMLREVGYCSGIENYSRHMDQREPGTHPWTLMDYLPSDYLLVIDESHMSVPQVRGMYNGDRSRKETLVEYGFRLPSALDNRPLTFKEFEQEMSYTIYTSATPGPYEMARADQVVEQIIRPTGLVDPEVVVRPIEGQVDDLVAEIHKRVEVGQRTLVTTLTKRMAEKLADYLMELGIKVHYLHSEIDTLERIGILRDLRLGVFDVVVGINLLREGLDLPEVSLVAILDADKEGFLRSETALIQTIGRAARHVEGKVIMYADKMTDSMRHALDETNRRRAKQVAYNEAHNIQPVSIFKAVRDLTDQLSTRSIAEPKGEYKVKGASGLPKSELQRVIAEMEKSMKEAARDLEFEKAAILRDQIYELRAILAEESNLPPWEKVRLLSGEEE